MSKKEILVDVLFGLFLIATGILTRTVWHIGPNIEFVTALSVLSGYLIKNNVLKYIVPIAIMLGSDLIIGNTSIYIFTWSGFLVMPVLGSLIKKFEKNKFLNYSSTGIVGVLFFFLWTNFGVMLLSSVYTKDLTGLMDSYVNGLPFLVNQLVGNLIILPLVYFGGTKLYGFLSSQLNVENLSINISNLKSAK